MPNTMEILNKIDMAHLGINYAVGQTVHFGTDIEIPEPGIELCPTINYQKWFMWWVNYMEELTTERREELQLAFNSGKDLTDIKPNGYWQNVRL